MADQNNNNMIITEITEQDNWYSYIAKSEKILNNKTNAETN